MKWFLLSILIIFSSIESYSVTCKQFIQSEKDFNLQLREMIDAGFDGLVFVDGERLKPLSELEIQKNESFTVAIYNDDLVLGRNIIGIEDGRLGGKGSHLSLLKSLGVDITKQDDRRAFLGFLGAVKFDDLGRILISGYHNKNVDVENSDMAAYRIYTLISKIFPNHEVLFSRQRVANHSTGL